MLHDGIVGKRPPEAGQVPLVTRGADGGLEGVALHQELVLRHRASLSVCKHNYYGDGFTFNEIKLRRSLSTTFKFITQSASGQKQDTINRIYNIHMETGGISVSSSDRKHT